MNKIIKKMFKISVATILFMIFYLSFSQTSYANQTNWYQVEDGRWRVKKENGEDLKNIWLLDNDLIYYKINEEGYYTGEKKDNNLLHTQYIDMEVYNESKKNLLEFSLYNDYYGYAKRSLDFVNNERAKVGVAPLELDISLTELGTYIASNMKKYNYYAHEMPNKYVNEAFLVAPSFFEIRHMLGENINYITIKNFKVSNYRKEANDFVEKSLVALRNSKGHYESMINPKFKKMGIGIAMNINNDKEEQKYYYVQEFTS